MERATMEKTWIEVMREKLEKEIGEKLEKQMTNRELASSREMLLGILSDRFVTLPASLTASIEACANLDRLRAATRKAGTVASLDDFQLQPGDIAQAGK